MVSLKKNFYLLLVIVFLYPSHFFSQDILKYTLNTVYFYKDVAINGKKGRKKFHSKMDKTLRIKTSQFSFYECQINENIAIIVKSNSDIKILNNNKLSLQVLKGSVLFKLKSLSSPFLIKSGLTQVKAQMGEFKIRRKSHETIVSVRNGTISVTSSKDSQVIEIKAHDKLSIKNGAIGTVERINDFERACLNDLKDVIFYSEADLIKQNTR